MNTSTTFFRLLHVPIDAKGDALAERIAALNSSASLNATGAAEETYTLDPAAFAQIPGSPFAYWASPHVLSIFAGGKALHEEARVCSGPDTGNDVRFLRLSWEVPVSEIGVGRRWNKHPKGGVFSRYYDDVHMLIDWALDGASIREHGNVRNPEYYFRPGLTWPLRTQKGLNLRAMPAGCIFGHKGPAVFVHRDDPEGLLVLLAVMNSSAFHMFVRLQMVFGSYEVGVIQRTPIPDFTDHASRIILTTLAREAHELQRDHDRTDETTHAFCLPGLVMHRDSPTLREASAALDAGEATRQARLAAIQAQIDDIVFDLYGLSEADRALVRRETGSPQLEAIEEGVEVEEEAEEEIAAPQDPIARVQDFLMWCVGVAFGRWDVRKALDPSLLRPLDEPFDPLPRYASGALIDDPAGPQSSIENQQSKIPSDGILVDAPSHPSDIVRRVREVLDLLWGERAEAVENEACEILGVKSLREYFRDPRRFFAYHIKRYSKSRRKAPIYWLLQSERRSYGIWLYYHRITPMTFYIAGRDYADGKIALERGRLDDLRAGLDSLTGGARRNREREIERQEKLVAEVAAFGKTLDKIALANLPPDPNDGVLISIAPLHPLVPWKEAEHMWDTLRSGQYTWSTMAKKMAEGGRQ